MSDRKEGGPAFPVVLDQWDCGHEKIMPKQIAPGLSLRDYMATKAMQMHGEMLSDMAIDGEEAWDEYIAKRAYKTADAMLKAREQ